MEEAVKKIVEKLLGISLSQIFLLAALWAAYQYHPAWVRENWLAVAVLVLFYEAAALIAAFAGKVWAQELETDAVKATAGWMRAAFRKFAPGFRRRYNQQVIRDHEIFNVRGLGLMAAHTLKLEQVFVDLKVSTTSNPYHFNFDPVTARQLAQTRSVWDFARAGRDRSGAAVALAIIGPPGSGKTTLLQHVAVTLAANAQRRYRSRAYTPILLFLRDHTEAIARNPSITLGQLAQQHFNGRYSKLKPPPDWFERQLASGACLVLLDGLDEVAQQEQRAAMSHWMDRQMANYPRCRFIVTSRPHGYRAAPLERANVVEVQPFSGEQVARFIRHWYLANEVVSSGNWIDEGVRQRAERGAADLLKRLRDPRSEAIGALTVNPLLLTMIVMVHRYRGALPGSRVALYREICEVLLERWRQAKDLQDNLTADQKRLVLMPLAARMMESELQEIGLDEAMDVIRQPLRRVGVTGAEAAAFLARMQESSGLVVERESGRWSFAHLTFQEYLTSAWWASGKSAPQDWRSLVERSWWHESLRLYAAQSDATPLVRACLAANSVEALTLAADIVEEGREVDEDARRGVEERVDVALESNDQDLRRLGAEVLLNRRLKSLLRIDERREIDLSLLSFAEYQLFLDEMRSQGKYHQPDHWLDFSFGSGRSREPVRGMRAEDAAAFCEWLTARQGGDVRYRLPAPDEALRHPAANDDEIVNGSIATWCGDGGGFSLAGLPDSYERKIRQIVSGLSDLPLPSDFDLSLRPVSATALDAARSLAPDHALAVALDLGLDRVRSLAFDLALAFACARAHRLDRSIARAFDSDFEGAFALDHARELARALARDLACRFEGDSGRGLRRPPDAGIERLRDIDAALESAAGVDRARSSAGELLGMLEAGGPQARVATLIGDHLRIACARDRLSLRHAWQEYAAHLLEFVHHGLRRLPPDSLSSEGRQELRGETGSGHFPEALLEAYWWLKIAPARADGRLPAWEGIRIVRERNLPAG
jgi:hypothetical protein